MVDPKKSKEEKTGQVKRDATQSAAPNTFKYMGVDFPDYFKKPRWVQTHDQSFTLAIDTSEMTMEMKAAWNSKYLPQLARLAKLVLEKLTKENIKSL